MKNYRIAGQSLYHPDENTFLAAIELAPAEETDEKHLFVSLWILDDAVEWCVTDYDYNTPFIRFWGEGAEEPGYDLKYIEEYGDFEDTAESPYRIFFCMLMNLYNLCASTFTLS